MITVRVGLSPDGRLQSLDASGHGGEIAGTDIVCAAATALLRTGARILVADPRIEASGAAPVGGTLWFQIGEVADERRAMLAAVTEFLTTGLQDLSEEYPKRVRLDIVRGDQAVNQKRN